MIVIIFNNSCGPFLLTIEVTRLLLSVVWFSEEPSWQNEGNFHNVLLEGKFCRFDSIGIRLYRNGICRGKNHCVFVKSSVLLTGSSYFLYYLLFSSKIV